MSIMAMWKSTDHSDYQKVLKTTPWIRGVLTRFKAGVFVKGVLVEGVLGVQHPGTLSTRECLATRESLVFGFPVLQSRSSGEHAGNLEREY